MKRGRATNKALSPPEHPDSLSDIMFPSPEPKLNWIPVNKIVNGLGQGFTTEQHHFVRFLESGLNDFERFYRIHQPETALQALFIDETLPGPAGKNLLSLPWQKSQGPTRAAQHFGPAADLEIATEAARLDKIRQSLKKYGLLEGRRGKPGGQIWFTLFLHDTGDYRMVITNGNHRVACLVHLGWELIPAHHQDWVYPVRLSDLAQWPGVVDGRFSRETARAMFEALFRPTRQQLLPGW